MADKDEIMKFPTSDLEAAAVDAIDPSTIHPATDENGTLKLVGGKPVYPVRGVTVRDETGRSVNSTLRVFVAPTAPIPAMSTLRCVDCHIAPWIRKGELTVSVIADHLEIIETPAHRQAAKND